MNVTPPTEHPSPNSYLITRYMFPYPYSATAYVTSPIHAFHVRTPPPWTPSPSHKHPLPLPSMCAELVQGPSMQRAPPVCMTAHRTVAIPTLHTPSFTPALSQTQTSVSFLFFSLLASFLFPSLQLHYISTSTAPHRLPASDPLSR